MKMYDEVGTAYDIGMRTPVGVRHGQMVVYQNRGKIRGQMDILNHREPFEGSIDADGNCKITGRMITLTQTICYIATGRITSERLTLFIDDGQNAMEITGYPAGTAPE